MNWRQVNLQALLKRPLTKREQKIFDDIIDLHDCKLSNESGCQCTDPIELRQAIRDQYYNKHEYTCRRLTNKIGSIPF